jgi:hypothetical protein
MRHWRAQIVTDVSLVNQKFGRHLRAYEVQAVVVRASIATTVPVKAGEGLGRATLQWGAKDIFRGGHDSETPNESMGVL